MIGVIGFMWWGDGSKLITALYWIVIWPLMVIWTMLANKEDVKNWIRSHKVKDEWKKIKDYFKIDIRGEE
jgi:hypothetical protein